MINIDWQTMLAVGVGGIVTALLTGKLIRRVVLLPFEWLSKKTESKLDDKLVEEARHDLGIPDETLPREDDK